MSGLRKFKFRPAYVGLAAVIGSALFTLTAFWHCGGGWGHLLFALVFPLGTGAVSALFALRRFYVWMTGSLFGTFIGIVSVVPLLLGESFEGEFFVCAATVLFFAVLGLLFGAIAEFVRLLHFVTHGGNILEYPGRPAEDAKPGPPPW